MEGIVSQVRGIVGVSGDPAVDVAGLQYDPRELTTRSDVTDVLGLTEREFVEAILADNGGCAWAGTFTEVTNWSGFQVRTLLDELADEGAVVCERADQDVVVCLPEANGITQHTTR